MADFPPKHSETVSIFFFNYYFLISSVAVSGLPQSGIQLLELHQHSKIILRLQRPEIILVILHLCISFLYKLVI